MTSVLDDVGARLTSGLPPTADQLQELAATPDLVRLGMLGDQVRRRKHGATTTFVRVAPVDAQSVERAEWPTATQEIRLQGTPSSADDAVQLAATLVRRAGPIAVTAWSLDDLVALAPEDRELETLVARLADAGIYAIADTPVDRLADPVRAVGAVLRAGGLVERVTVRHVRDTAAAVAHLHRVRALQKATGAVRVFAPLPSAPDARVPSTGYDDARLVVLARVFLDAVESIQVDWRVYGPKLAQVALLFGADDLDAVSAEEGAEQGRRRAALEEVRRNIAAAGFSPVERTARWGIVTA